MRFRTILWREKNPEWGEKIFFSHDKNRLSRRGMFLSHEKIPGDMTKRPGGVTKNLGGVTKTSGGPAGKFCHMKKNILGQKKCVFGESREFCGASRKFRDVSFGFFGVAGKFCGVAQGFRDVSGRFRDVSGIFCHVARKFCGVAGSKPRTAARSQAPSTAEPRHPKNVGYVTVACGNTPIAARSILSGVSSRRVSSARRQPR